MKSNLSFVPLELAVYGELAMLGTFKSLADDAEAACRNRETPAGLLFHPGTAPHKKIPDTELRSLTDRLVGH